MSIIYENDSWNNETLLQQGGLRYSRFATGLECVRQTALSTVLAVVVERHKDSSSAIRALAAKTLDLAVRLHLVILQDGHLDLLALVLDLLGGVVRLFLALLRATA